MKSAGQTPMLFGYALKKLREEAGITQEELAQRAKMQRSAIAKLEADQQRQPRWETLIRLAEGLGTSVDAFLDAARRYTPPPLDRLEQLEGMVRELGGRVSGLEDRQLEAAKIVKTTRDKVSQIDIRLSGVEGKRRQR